MELDMRESEAIWSVHLEIIRLPFSPKIGQKYFFENKYLLYRNPKLV